MGILTIFLGSLSTAIFIMFLGDVKSTTYGPSSGAIYNYIFPLRSSNFSYDLEQHSFSVLGSSLGLTGSLNRKSLLLYFYMIFSISWIRSGCETYFDSCSLNYIIFISLRVLIFSEILFQSSPYFSFAT